MPSEFVAVTVETPVCTSVMVTVAPATTAPEESTTVPLISPVFALCPNARPVVKVAANSTPIRTYLPIVSNVIATPPQPDSHSDQRPSSRSICPREIFRHKPATRNTHLPATGGESYAERANPRIRQKSYSRKVFGLTTDYDLWRGLEMD